MASLKYVIEENIEEYVGLSNNSLTSLSGCSNSAITD